MLLGMVLGQGPSGGGAGAGAGVQWSKGSWWWLGQPSPHRRGHTGEEEPNFAAPSASLLCREGPGRMRPQCKESLPRERWDFSSGAGRELILCARLSTFISLTPALSAAALSVFLAGR